MRDFQKVRLTYLTNKKKGGAPHNKGERSLFWGEPHRDKINVSACRRGIFPTDWITWISWRRFLQEELRLHVGAGGGSLRVGMNCNQRKKSQPTTNSWTGNHPVKSRASPNQTRSWEQDRKRNFYFSFEAWKWSGHNKPEESGVAFSKVGGCSKSVKYEPFLLYSIYSLPPRYTCVTMADLLSEGSRSIAQERERRVTIDQESHISYTRPDTPFFVILFFDWPDPPTKTFLHQFLSPPYHNKAELTQHSTANKRPAHSTKQSWTLLAALCLDTLVFHTPAMRFKPPPFSGSRATTMAWHRKSDRNLSLTSSWVASRVGRSVKSRYFVISPLTFSRPPSWETGLSIST